MFDQYEFEKIEYKGVPILYKKIPTAPCIHVDIGFRFGAYNDPKEKLGISHFLEHIPFDGSEKFPNPDSLKKFSKNFLLDSFNAYTSHEEVVFYARMLPEKFTEGILGMADIVLHPLLKMEDVERERGIITQEAWSGFKNQKNIDFLKRTNQSLYPVDHPFYSYRSPLGWPETIRNITQADLIEWQKTMLVRENLFIGVAGNITDETIAQLKNIIDAIPTGIPVIRQTKDYILSNPQEARLDVNSKDIGLEMKQSSINIMVLEKTPSKETYIKNNTSRNTLYDILFRELREKRGICYSVNYSRTTSSDITRHAMYVALDEKNIIETEKIIHEVLRDFSTGIYAEDFETEKESIIENIKSDEMLTEHIMDFMKFNYINYGEIPSKATYLEMLEKSNYIESRKYIEGLFAPEKIMTVIIRASE